MCEIGVVVRLTGRDHAMRPNAWDDRGDAPHADRHSRSCRPRSATRDGLAYSLWLPDGPPVRGGIVILHGAGSCKESHYDFARAALPLGLAAISFDQRGHGESGWPLDGRRSTTSPRWPVAAPRGRSTTRCPDRAARLEHGRLSGDRRRPDAGAAAVVAICPASAARAPPRAGRAALRVRRRRAGARRAARGARPPRHRPMA